MTVTKQSDETSDVWFPADCSANEVISRLVWGVRLGFRQMQLDRESSFLVEELDPTELIELINLINSELKAKNYAPLNR